MVRSRNALVEGMVHGCSVELEGCGWRATPVAYSAMGLWTSPVGPPVTRGCDENTLYDCEIARFEG